MQTLKDSMSDTPLPIVFPLRLPDLPDQTAETHDSALSTKLGLDNSPCVIRQSAAADLQRCPRKFAFKYRFRLRRKGDGYASAREVGSMTHLIVKCLLEGASLEGAMRECHKYLDSIAVPEESRAAADKDLALATAMAVSYWEKFSLNPNRWHVIGSEITISVKLPGVVAPLSGTIDLLLWDREKNEIWIHDLKTTGNSPVKRQATVEYEPQTRIYRILATAYVAAGLAKTRDEEPVPPETPVVGVQYNVIKRPTIRQKQKQTAEAYIAEVGDWYAGRGEHEGTTTGGPHAIVPPYPFRFRGGLVSYEFAKQLRMLDRAATEYCGFASCPRTLDTKQCYGGPGQSSCEYDEICSADPRLWKTIVKTLYDQAEKPPELTEDAA